MRCVFKKYHLLLLSVKAFSLLIFILVVLGIHSSECVVVWLFIRLGAFFSFTPKSQSFLRQMIKLFYDLMYCLSLVSRFPPLENSPQIEVRKMTAKGGGGGG